MTLEGKPADENLVIIQMLDKIVKADPLSFAERCEELFGIRYGREINLPNTLLVSYALESELGYSTVDMVSALVYYSKLRKEGVI